MPDEPFIHYPDERQPAQVRPGHPSPAHDQEHEQPAIPEGFEQLLAAERNFCDSFHGGQNGMSPHADHAWRHGYKPRLLEWRAKFVAEMAGLPNSMRQWYRDQVARIDAALKPRGQK